MLQIDFDVPDVLVTDPGLAMIDPARSFQPVLQKAGVSSPYFVPPSRNALILRPIQLLPGWPTAVKFRAGDYGSPSGWEEQQLRASGDWYMHSSGAVTPLSLRYTFPANTGWFIEFQAYRLPKATPGPLFDFLFGQYFLIVISSDGHMALYDTRIGLLTPVATGNIAQLGSVDNLDVSLLILPFRRSHILVWSPNRGGFVDAAVTVGSSGNITEASSPTLYSSVTPPAALVSVTPLLYPADSVPAIAAPKRALGRPLSCTPTFDGSVFDQPGKSSVTLTALTPYVPGTVITSFGYSVTMAGNVERQSAEEQGVSGIGPSTSTSTGDSLFSGSGLPYALTTPFLYLTAFGYPRLLGVKATSTTTLTGILRAKLVLSKDREAKSFTFAVDNPANITGVGPNYTALKDQQNRRCRAYLTNESLEAGEPSSAIAADPDPDTPLIVAYGYRRVYLFDGFSDQSEFVDGTGSLLRLRCLGLRKRLRGYLFSDQPHYDGWNAGDVVADVLQRAGFIGSGDAISGSLGVEIVTQTPSMTLPCAVPGDEPLFTPAIGTTAEEFLQLLINYTGWQLDDLIAAGATNGAWYWTSQNYYTDSVYAAQGTPIINRSSTFVSGFTAGSETVSDATRPNQGLGALTMLGDPAPHQVLEDPIANDIYVLGVGDSGQVIVAHARDEGSISNESNVNYIGEPRLYIYVSQTINSQEVATEVCAALYTSLTPARTRIVLVMPDYYPQLGISAPVTVAGYWNGAIEGIEADLGQLNLRRTVVSILRDAT